MAKYRQIYTGFAILADKLNNIVQKFSYEINIKNLSRNKC